MSFPSLLCLGKISKKKTQKPTFIRFLHLTNPQGLLQCFPMYKGTKSGYLYIILI
jgi:hypothetical protein